jgi:hypothetical protein
MCWDLVGPGTEPSNALSGRSALRSGSRTLDSAGLPRLRSPVNDILNLHLVEPGRHRFQRPLHANPVALATLFTGANPRTDLARPFAVVTGSGVNNGKEGKKAVQVEPQVHFGSGPASEVFGPADAVGDQFHHSGIDGVNRDLETAQESLAFFARGKAPLDVLMVFENRAEQRLDKFSRTNLVCVKKSVVRGGGDLEATQSRAALSRSQSQTSLRLIACESQAKSMEASVVRRK